MLNLFVLNITVNEYRTQKGNLKYLQELRILARKNRNHPTLAEALFWKKIKRIQPHFLRQKPIGRFIVDFLLSKIIISSRN